MQRDKDSTQQSFIFSLCSPVKQVRHSSLFTCWTLDSSKLHKAHYFLNPDRSLCAPETESSERPGCEGMYLLKESRSVGADAEHSTITTSDCKRRLPGALVKKHSPVFKGRSRPRREDMELPAYVCRAFQLHAQGDSRTTIAKKSGNTTGTYGSGGSTPMPPATSSRPSTATSRRATVSSPRRCRCWPSGSWSSVCPAR